MDGGITADSSSKKRTRIDRPQALPTKDEQKQLQQVELLLKGNLLQLQVHELLQTVSTEAHSVSHKKKVHAWVQSIRDVIMTSPLTGQLLSQHWLETTGSDKELHLIQYAATATASTTSATATADAAVSMLFAPPIATEILGSWDLGTAVAPMVNVDVAVIMNPAMFDARDILNHVYFDKRRLFLAALCNTLQQAHHPPSAATAAAAESSLKKTKKNKRQRDDSPIDASSGSSGDNNSINNSGVALFSCIEVALFKGDARKPILQLSPPAPQFRQQSQLRLRLIPVLPTSAFRVHQLRAQKNNVRPARWLQQIQRDTNTAAAVAVDSKQQQQLDAAALPPTPEYNLSVLEDMAMLTQQLLISKAVAAAGATNNSNSSGNSNVVALTILLLKIWLTQRGFRHLPDGFDGHHAALLVAYLLQTRRLQLLTQQTHSAAATTAATTAAAAAASSDRGGSSESAAAWSNFQKLLSFLAETDLLQSDLDFTSVAVNKSQSSTPRSRQLIEQYYRSSADDAATVTATSSAAATADAWNYQRPLLLRHPLAPSPAVSGCESLNKPSDLAAVGYNALWRVSAATAARLRSAAAASVQQLRHMSNISSSGCGDSSCGGESLFHALLMQQRNFFEMHDAYFHFALPADATATANAASSSTKTVSIGITAKTSTAVATAVATAADEFALPVALHRQAAQHYAAHALELLRDGFGDRAVAVDAVISSVCSSSSRSCGDEPPVFTASPHSPCVVVQDSDCNSSNNGDDSSNWHWVVSVGVSLNPELAERRVDRALISSQQGTAAAEEEKQQQFRCLWGEKVQLRRFKDGVIAESVVWQPQPLTATVATTATTAATGGGSVVEQVVRYLLGRHLPAYCGQYGERVRAVSSQHFDAAITSASVTVPASAGAEVVQKQSASEVECRRAVEALDKLRSILTSDLKTAAGQSALPLAFESLSALTPQLRYTAVHPPAANPLLHFLSSSSNSSSGSSGNGRSNAKAFMKQFAGKSVPLLVAPIRVIAQLESSSKWPVLSRYGFSADSLAADRSWAEAVRKLKLAMLLKTRKELMKQHQLHCSVHEGGDGCCFMDVCLDGYLFRVLLIAGNEEVESKLLRIEENTRRRCTADAVPALLPPLHRKLTWPQLHHQGVRSLQSHVPSFAGAVKLLTAWAGEHCFSGHLSVELIELLVAAEYIRGSNSGQQPQSPMSGFYRSLRLLSQHDWENQPLVVDFSAINSSIGRDDDSAVSVAVAASVAVKEKVVLDIDAAAYAHILAQFAAVRNHHQPQQQQQQLGADSSISQLPPAAQLRSLNVPMYIVSSADKDNNFWPAAAMQSPELVVLGMMRRSAQCSADKLLHWMSKLPHWNQEKQQQEQQQQQEDAALVVDVMRSAAVLRRCDVILRFTRSVVPEEADGIAPFARLKVFANMPAADISMNSLLVRESSCPRLPLQQEVFEKLQRAFRADAVFFWNAQRGDAIGVLWRPHVKCDSHAQSFGILSCRNHTVLPTAGSYSSSGSGSGKKQKKNSSEDAATAAGVVRANVEQLLIQMLELGAGLLVQAEERDP